MNTCNGMNVIEVETDYKPLESILRKPLYQAPSRPQKMITFLESNYVVIADTLLRAYTLDPSNNSASFEFKVAKYTRYNTNFRQQTPPIANRTET